MFLPYLVKLSISLGVIWIFYQLVLRRLTFYHWNRVFLLTYSLVAFCIPFINIEPVLLRSQWAEHKVVQAIPVVESLASTDKDLTNHGSNWIIVFFASGCILLVARFVIQHFSFLLLKRSAKIISRFPVKLYQVDKNIIPFSFAGSIFINRHQHSDEDLKKIIRHEFVHVTQKHSVDMLWAEWLCILNWYNPFAWLIRNSIRQNLEFIADDTVIQNGIDRKQYQYLLLKVIGSSQYSIASNFNFTSLKKRIAMMNKMRSARVHLMRFLFVLPIVAMMLLAFRNNISKQETVQSTIHESYVYDTVPLPGKAQFPKNVTRITQEDNLVTVTLKDGTKETYDLNRSDEKAAFEKKYGQMPQPPAPPIPTNPPSPPSAADLPSNVSTLDIENKKATIQLKDGKIEHYDLSKPGEKEAFEKKYGKILPVVPKPPTAPAAPKSPTKVSVTVTGVEPKIATEVKAPTITPVAPKPPTKVSVTVTGVEPRIATEVKAPTITPVAPKPPTKVSVTLTDVEPRIATEIKAPVPITHAVTEGIVDIQPEIHFVTVSDNDELLAEINNKTSIGSLDLLKKQLQAKEYTLTILNADFQGGVLKSIDAIISDNKNKSRFTADDFGKILIWKTTYENGKSGFSVRIMDGTVRFNQAK